MALQRFYYSGYFTWGYLFGGIGWSAIALLKIAANDHIAWIAVYAITGAAFILFFLLNKRTPCLEFDEEGITKYLSLRMSKRYIKWADVSDVKYSAFLVKLTLISPGQDKVPIRFSDVSTQDRERLKNMILEALVKYSSPEVLRKTKALLSKS